MPTIQEDLQKYFGYSSFLPYQEAIITDVINKKDVLAVLATGGGKSICYQLPSVHLDGVAIVISPLKALMKDQVDSLTAHGIPAATINSSNYPEHRRIMEDARSGRLKLLYVSPERIVQNNFMEFLCSLTLSLIAVDEAHCISMWGHNFRPEYRELQTIHKRFPRVPIIALTATAIPQVRDDIILQLGLRDPTVYIGSFHRKNLYYSVRPKNKNTINEIVTYLSAHQDDSGIIYCLARKTTEEVAEKLRNRGFNAHHFHASLSTGEKEDIQDKIIKGDIPIICATIAFGMGIDKPDVRFVIHYDLPKNLESYYQETGRAGRDGDPSDCILFYGRGDIVTRRQMVENDSYSDPIQLKAAHKKLNDLLRFVEIPECRKTHLMRYFGEHLTPDECSGCDICDSPSASFDGKEIASIAYQGIREFNGKFGVSTIADILYGSRNKKILGWNLDRCQSFGSGTRYSTTELKDYISQLTAMGYFSVSDSKYPLISLTEKSPELTDPTVQITLRKSERPVDNKQSKTSHRIQEAGDPELFALLKKKRLELAREADLPPFIIMYDITLREISLHQPLTEEEWATIPGISLGKYQKYGEAFNGVIREFRAHAETDTEGRSERPLVAEEEATSHLTEETEDPELFDLLKEKRVELAKKLGFPINIIVQDKVLHEVSVRQPLTKEEWLSIQGIGAGRFQSFGEPFTEVIREYQARAQHETLDHPDTTGEQDNNSSQINHGDVSSPIRITKEELDTTETQITGETPSPFFKETEEEIDWVDVYLERTYPDGCSPVSNAQKTKELSIRGRNPGEIAAISGYSMMTISKHLLDLSLSGEMDAYDCVSPFMNEQEFIEIAATLRAITEEKAEPEIFPHLKRFYSETEINFALIRLIHDKNMSNTLPQFPELSDIDRNDTYPREFLPLLSDTNGIFPFGVLTRDLTDEEYRTRKSAAKMLGYLGEPDGIIPLITQLRREKKNSVTAEIIRALTALQDRDHPQEISHYLHDSAPTVCSAAIQYLKQSSSEYLIPEIGNLLNNSSDMVRKAAVWILDENPGPDTTDWLYRIMENDSSGYIRATAAHILGKRRNPSDYNLILPLVTDPDTLTYRGVVTGLAACDAKRAIPDLMNLLNSSPHETIRRAAITTLVDLDSSLLPDLYQRAQSDSSTGVREAFVWKLGTIGGAKAAKMIRSFASDPSPYVRETVARSLKETTYTASVACLQTMLTDTSPIVRRCAHEALLNMKAHYL